MTDILNIGLSALLAQQRALSVTANNVANASTPGYSRQRVEFTERSPERVGSSYFGTGVNISNVRRITDDVLAAQLRGTESGFGRADVFATLAASIDDLLADTRIGFASRFQTFANAVQDLANDPAASATRTALLSEARQLVSTLQSIDGRLDELSQQVGADLSTSVLEVNNLASAIAEINRQVVLFGSATGGPPANLLDERDQLVQELAKLVRVQAVEQDDGTLSVFIGSGQSLVLGTSASELAVVAGPFGPQQPDIVIRSPGADLVITPFVNGGKLGGLLDFRREMLEPVRNEVGLFTVGLVDGVNAVHREGIDLTGQLGDDFFTVAPPFTAASSANSGTASVSAVVEDVATLAPVSYRLFFDGASYQLLEHGTGTPVPMTGSGSVGDPFRANGIAIVASGAPAAGDQFLIEPLAQSAGSIALAIGSTAEIAAAAPTRTRMGATNIGTATISAGEVADSADPNLLTTATIEFLTPTTYSVDGSGSFAYTDGGDILVNGTRVQISGAPAAGDQFIIEANTGGVGDNRNALRLGEALTANTLAGGTTSLIETVSQLVAAVGAQTAEVGFQRDAQTALRTSARESLDSVRGVNLDEEAVKMLEQEQLYQAATRIFAVADDLFQTLIAAIR